MKMNMKINLVLNTANYTNILILIVTVILNLTKRITELADYQLTYTFTS